MLRLTKNESGPAVALDDCGGTVMLTLDDGKGHRFSQALDAHDVGRVLAACRGIPEKDERAVCQGDLLVRPELNRRLTLRWVQDGGTASVLLLYPDNLVFQEALKGWCRMLMRTKPGKALFP